MTEKWLVLFTYLGRLDCNYLTLVNPFISLHFTIPSNNFNINYWTQTRRSKFLFYKCPEIGTTTHYYLWDRFNISFRFVPSDPDFTSRYRTITTLFWTSGMSSLKVWTSLVIKKKFLFTWTFFIHLVYWNEWTNR